MTQNCFMSPVFLWSDIKYKQTCLTKYFLIQWDKFVETNIKFVGCSHDETLAKYIKFLSVETVWITNIITMLTCLKLVKLVKYNIYLSISLSISLYLSIYCVEMFMYTFHACSCMHPQDRINKIKYDDKKQCMA